MLFEYYDKNNDKRVIGFDEIKKAFINSRFYDFFKVSPSSSLHDLIQTLMEEKYDVTLSHNDLEPIVHHIRYQI